jgi:DNA-binding NtrC family response regulator
VEREYILAALGRNNGNRTLTAEWLEIGPATLFQELKRSGDDLCPAACSRSRDARRRVITSI